MTETILDRILEKKKEEVADFYLNGFDLSNLPKRKYASLYNTFINSNELNVIAEIKRASPSKGDINIGVEPREQARLYADNGANAISVLTDTPFFKGTMNDLISVRKEVDIPILCKDFIIDKIQIDRAKSAGANVILLIAAALSYSKISELYLYAKEQEFEVLFEVHNEEELDTAHKVGANIIGINNRNLNSFEVDLANTELLAKKIDRSNIVIISESGIRNKEDATRLAAAGVHGILVGETLMKSSTLNQTLTSLKVRR
ncbi:indole-3-glycerol phosphate synthase [Bacillus pakistanensis]|uniref:Indole-3-glycerol phosphate synthase n=1 Tax=Rossellomorea pakistanensis TaxID=992288 RepID=A0ABS2N8I0_9BACI|nr:indole-3-glycerol phosphate synthase TrpC [Bacillus pakistanensis]MBM7584166.1 indole-3-glycerol phosphate synthase [Bacillus pakistanensis]